MNASDAKHLASAIEQIADALEEHLVTRQDVADELRDIALRLRRQVNAGRKPVRILAPGGRA
jgi:hypothetical protein